MSKSRKSMEIYAVFFLSDGVKLKPRGTTPKGLTNSQVVMLQLGLLFFCRGSRLTPISSRIKGDTACLYKTRGFRKQIFLGIDPINKSYRRKAIYLRFLLLWLLRKDVATVVPSLYPSLRSLLRLLFAIGRAAKFPLGIHWKISNLVYSLNCRKAGGRT